MKKLIQILLIVVIVALGWLLYDQIMTPLDFQKNKAMREAAVIERVKDIRTAQRAYKQAKQGYAKEFSQLVDFLLNDSLVYEKAIGSADDSLAVAKGLVKVEKFAIAAKDTVFGVKKLSIAEIKDFENIPYGAGTKFIMDAGELTTESQVTVSVFECKAPYKSFLSDLDQQELINLVDECNNTLLKYAGIKVGSMEQATNDAGNWE